jgi:hypothetical protein
MNIGKHAFYGFYRGILTFEGYKNTYIPDVRLSTTKHTR